MANIANSATSLTLLGRLRDQPDDQASWQQFVDRYGGMIRQWCLHWGLQEADALDVTQNVLLKMAGQMRKFEYRVGGRFRSWLRTVAYHAWCDYLKEQQRPGGGSGDEAIAAMLNSLEARERFLKDLEDEVDRNLLDDAMQLVEARVEAHTWQAFVAMAVEGQSGADVAEKLGMKIGTVYVAKSKVQRMLQEQIRRFEHDD